MSDYTGPVFDPDGVYVGPADEADDPRGSVATTPVPAELMGSYVVGWVAAAVEEPFAGSNIASLTRDDGSEATTMVVELYGRKVKIDITLA